MGSYFSKHEDFEELIANAIVDGIFKSGAVRFYKIDNFLKLNSFISYESNYHPYQIRSDRIEFNYHHQYNYGYIYYKLDDRKSFTKIIIKVREKLIAQNFTDEEFESLIDNNESIQEKFIIEYKEKLDKIKLFLKITKDYSDNKILLQKLQDKNILNIPINNHLNNILKGEPKEPQDSVSKFGLLFKFNEEIYEYTVDTFILNYDFFNILITGNNFIKSSKVTLEINNENTGKDFIIYLYTTKLPFELSIQNIGRIQSLKTLADFCGMEDLNQHCINIIKCIED